MIDTSREGKRYLRVWCESTVFGNNRKGTEFNTLGFRNLNTLGTYNAKTYLLHGLGI